MRCRLLLKVETHALASLLNFENIPFPKIAKEEQHPLIKKADIMLTKNRELHELKADFFKKEDIEIVETVTHIFH